MESLASLRRRIDALDDRILALLNARARVVKRVYVLKQKWSKVRASGPSVGAFVPAREEEIFQRLAARSAGPFPVKGLRPVFREIISACRSLEGAFKVAAAGNEASPAYCAARDCFGAMAHLLPAPGVSGVQKLMERGSVAYGVVPASALKRFKGGPFASYAVLKGAKGGASFVVLGRSPSPLA